jgi:hypothetical protein
VSRFLAAHEECGAGFQITRTGEPGRPRLRLLCQGCGQRAAYAAGDAGLLGEEAESNGHTELPRNAPAEAAAGSPAAAASKSGSAMESWLPAPAALPWWVPNVYILLVIAIGLGLIAFGVVREQDEGGPPSFGSPEAGESRPEAQAPTPATVAPQPPAAAAPAQRPSADARRAKAQLEPVTVLNRFTIGVPDGWSRGESGGAAVFRSGSGAAEIRIFLQPGAEPLNRLERNAVGFVKQEHPGARVGPPESLRLGPNKAREIRATFKGGTETAVVVSADGYSYLLLGGVDSKAPASLETLTQASLHSFRPR